MARFAGPLLDWTGRQLKPGRREAIPKNAPPILDRLDLSPELWLHAVGLVEVHDGLSNTIAMSERRISDDDLQRFDPIRDIWLSSAEAVGFNVYESSIDDTIQICALAPSDPGPMFSPYAGRFFHMIGYEQTGYNHVLALNSGVTDCSLHALNFNTPQNSAGWWSIRGIVTALSLHRGRSVSVLYADGAVRPTAPDIDIHIWRVSATMSGSD